MRTIDSLKMHTFGVKKGEYEKQNRINELEQAQMRYYPVDKRGYRDEWGAVVRHQAEIQEKMQRDEREFQRYQARLMNDSYDYALGEKRRQRDMETVHRSMELNLMKRKEEEMKKLA